MPGKIPHDFAILGIERVNEAFSNAQGDHRSIVGVVDVSTSVFVLVDECPGQATHFLVALAGVDRPQSVSPVLPCRNIAGVIYGNSWESRPIM